MTFDYILILIIAVASISFKPGPGMAAIVSHTLERGFFAGFMICLGAITIELLYFVLAYFGFSLIENYLSSFTIILKIIGSAYLLYLAYHSFKKSKIIPKANKDLLNANEGNSLLKDYMTGIIVTLANPLVILFYSALIPTVLDLSTINLNGLLTALFVILMVNIILLTSQCLLASQVKILIQEKVTIQKLNFVSAILLTAVALYILFGLVRML